MRNDLFGPVPRRAPRTLMHVTDAGESGCAGGEPGEKFVQMTCARCNRSEWTWLQLSVAKRGIPCPDCCHTRGNDAND